VGQSQGHQRQKMYFCFLCLLLCRLENIWVIFVGGVVIGVAQGLFGA
jgi:hypothetical protein